MRRLFASCSQIQLYFLRLIVAYITVLFPSWFARHTFASLTFHRIDVVIGEDVVPAKVFSSATKLLYFCIFPIGSASSLSVCACSRLLRNTKWSEVIELPPSLSSSETNCDCINYGTRYRVECVDLRYISYSALRHREDDEFLIASFPTRQKKKMSKKKKIFENCNSSSFIECVFVFNFFFVPFILISNYFPRFIRNLLRR